MGTADGHVVGMTQIVNHGDPSQRWNLVILSEGYQQGQLDQFHTDVQNFVDTMSQTAPYNELWYAINIYRIDVVSTDSGAADPVACGGTGAAPHTYFDATFCSNGRIARLLAVNDGTVHNVVNTQFPQAHMILVIVNSTKYGGSGGGVAVFSLAGGAEEIALHETGHTAFGFTDEYCSYQGCGIDTDRNNYTGGEPPFPNATIDTNRATIKWGNLIASTTAMPTMTNPDCTQCNNGPNPVSADTVGTFEGAYYYHCGVYRGQYACRMRALGNPYCAVCQQVIRQTLAPFMAMFGTWQVTANGSKGQLTIQWAHALAGGKLQVQGTVTFTDQPGTTDTITGTWDAIAKSITFVRGPDNPVSQTFTGFLGDSHPERELILAGWFTESDIPATAPRAIFGWFAEKFS